MSTDALQAKLKKRLEAILKIPENQVCSDCRRRGIFELHIQIVVVMSSWTNSLIFSLYIARTSLGFG